MEPKFMQTQIPRDFDDAPKAGPVSSNLALQFGNNGQSGQPTVMFANKKEKSEAAPVVKADPVILDTGGFTEVDTSDFGLEFAGEWRPTMDTPNYIGETEMLLEYLKRQERLHKVTMPIQACGVDPILFDNVQLMDVPVENEGAESAKVTPRVFSIPSSQDEGGGVSAYELIKVDGELYLSCITECLDKEYLNSIIAEATSAVKACGRYTYEMVGYRKLALESGKNEGRLLNTLRLNSYEMSVLISYMSQFSGISITYQVIDNKQCICFVL